MTDKTANQTTITEPTAEKALPAGAVTVNLTRPVEWAQDGKLVLDLPAMTGEDLVAAEKEFMAVNPGFVGVASLTTEYLFCVAARALRRPVDDIKRLPAKDCLALTQAVNGFLYGSWVPTSGPAMS